MAIVEALEINLVEIKPRAQILKNLRRTVSVNESRDQAAAFAF